MPRFGILGCESLAKDYLTRVGYDECVPAKLQSFSACETGAYPSLVADWACGCSPPRALTQMLQTRARRRPRAPKTPGRVAGLVYGRSFLALLGRSRSAARRNSAAAYDTRSCVYARGTALSLFSKACHVASVKPTGGGPNSPVTRVCSLSAETSGKRPLDCARRSASSPRPHSPQGLQPTKTKWTPPPPRPKT